jgi:hypothetical protein
MGIMHTTMTDYGETRTMYVRLNNLEASNHGMPASALFRGYINKAAYQAGAKYVWEREVSFTPDLSKPLWTEAYNALISQEGVSDPTEI